MKKLLLFGMAIVIITISIWSYYVVQDKGFFQAVPLFIWSIVLSAIWVKVAFINKTK